LARTTQETAGASGCLAFLAVGLALTTSPPAQAAFPGANGRIAFTVQTWHPPPPPEPSIPEDPILVSSRIVSVLPNGQRQRRLHTVAVAQTPGAPRPAFSPSGKLIAFDEGGRLAIMRHDGTGLRVLPPLSAGDYSPAWSPTGRRLAFSGLRPCPFYCPTLFTVRPDGTGLRQVADYEAQRPAWSVKGRIAFLNNDDRDRMTIGPRDGLYSVGPDGSRERRLFGSFAALGNEPDWSPDGRRLAFRARGRIFTMKADGSKRRPITEGPRRYSHPTWSPDGRYIAVIGGEGDERDDYGLYVMRADGRGLRKVRDARRVRSRDGELREWEAFGPPSWQPLRG
jgi:hypothetical protein